MSLCPFTFQVPQCHSFHEADLFELIGWLAHRSPRFCFAHVSSALAPGPAQPPLVPGHFNSSHFAVAKLQHEPMAAKLPQKVVYKIQANVERFVVKASCCQPQRLKPGRFHCSEGTCGLHEVLEPTDAVIFFSKRVGCCINGCIICDPPHVINGWSCWECGVHGVGRRTFLKVQLLSYISAVEDIHRTSNTDE